MSSTTSAPRAFTALTDELGICFGGDYNPEQWPRETWREDVALMREAGVNLVTVGVFSWAMIEPVPGAREFDWLDEILDLLHENGIAVDLATPVASPPPWLGIQHPDTLPVDRDGVRLVPGSRNQFSPASTVYRAHALAITRDIAARYADHPAVRMWHVGNEYGQIDHGDEAAREFRRWLRDRYGTIDELNRAWGTAFWSQRYAAFEEILPPRRMPYLVNPTQSLDFRRYSSDQLLRCYRELRDAIREVAAQPITTNFMGFFAQADYHQWANEVDVIADDQYPDPADPGSASDIAFVQDLMRSLGGGAPWMLMEQSVSATSWRSHNLPKTPLRARRDSLQAVARGADAICYFQWRQAKAGAERFHSSMLPHAGADTEVFRGVVRQGADLRRLRQVTGTTVDSDVAIYFDWSAWWAGEEPARPTERLDTMTEINRWNRQLWRRGVPVDVVGPGATLHDYRVILVPHAYILEPGTAAALAAAVERGAQLVVGPFSGVADRDAQILQGRSPVLLRDVLGVSGEEWGGLPDGTTALTLADGFGTVRAADAAPTASVFAERLRLEGADALASFAEGDLVGLPVVTRNTTGDGAAWYLGAICDDGIVASVIADALHAAGVRGAIPELDELPEGLEAVRRGDVLFLLNHADSERQVPVAAGLIDLLTGFETTGSAVAIAAGDVRALSERRTW